LLRKPRICPANNEAGRGSGATKTDIGQNLTSRFARVILPLIQAEFIAAFKKF